MDKEHQNTDLIKKVKSITQLIVLMKKIKIVLRKDEIFISHKSLLYPAQKLCNGFPI